MEHSISGMATLVLGAQWGDEGKGKIVDRLSEHFDVVVRFQGGHNAGHTIWIDGEKIVLHLVPSGILHAGTTCVIGPGVVVEPESFLAEIAKLTPRVPDAAARIKVAESAALILPHHVAIDRARECNANPIGTTSKGIGPAYEDKVARRGLRMSDLYDEVVLREKFEKLADYHNFCLQHFYQQAPLDTEAVWGKVMQWRAAMLPFLCDTTTWLQGQYQSGVRILLEGAQGAALDIDHGSYPFVTSSSILGATGVGSGLAANQITDVLAIVKAYTTRVGRGAMPTELNDANGDFLRTAGGEIGATTGRNRRCGWLDLPLLRRTLMLSGASRLVLTKLDVLDTLAEIPICTHYRYKGELRAECSLDDAVLAECTPVYETLPGWQQSTNGITKFDDLPNEAQAYIAFIERALNIPIAIVSTGTGRNAVILRDVL